MIDINKLKVGDKVHYQPPHYGQRYENGRIKEIRSDNLRSIFVVYNCGGNWDNFKDYTSALTSLSDLKLGWRHE